MNTQKMVIDTLTMQCPMCKGTGVMDRGETVSVRSPFTGEWSRSAIGKECSRCSGVGRVAKPIGRGRVVVEEVEEDEDQERVAV